MGMGIGFGIWVRLTDGRLDPGVVGEEGFVFFFG